jgi:hypothetical protein
MDMEGLPKSQKLYAAKIYHDMSTHDDKVRLVCSRGELQTRARGGEGGVVEQKSELAK